MNLLLSPHPDDETLFAAYTLLEHHPLVVFCYAGAPRHGAREQRLAEATAAMNILGCDFLPPPEGDIEQHLRALAEPSRVWAPYPESGGHSAHNLVGNLAAKLWPGKVTWFTTYTADGRSRVGEPVEVREGWETLKLRALSCYQSQLDHPGTRPHFHRGLDEYLVEPPVEEQAVCADCGRSFKSAHGLSVHRAKAHPEEVLA